MADARLVIGVVGAPEGAELAEQPPGMGLDRVLGDEQLLGDLDEPAEAGRGLGGCCDLAEVPADPFTVTGALIVKVCAPGCAAAATTGTAEAIKGLPRYPSKRDRIGAKVAASSPTSPPFAKPGSAF